MAQIEANFKALMIANIDPYFAVICPLGLTCTANDIVITCGPIKSRKKRSGVSGDSSRQLRSSQIVNGKFALKRNVSVYRSTTFDIVYLAFYVCYRVHK